MRPSGCGRQREADAKRAREFREQMERARENARTRGEAEARRIIRQARAQADQVMRGVGRAAPPPGAGGGLAERQRGPAPPSAAS